MFISCDEAGHTGPDLLAKDQRYFAFASVNISDEDAYQIISEAREKYPVQMPELKASKLMSSNQGKRLAASIILGVEGRFAINAHDKLLALCGWVFEYIFEPVYQDDPRIFYRKNFHRFIAMYCYLWFMDHSSEARTALSQFQAFMRSKDVSDAPILFEFNLSENADGQPHPFTLIQRFATANRDLIASDVASIEDETTDKGRWTLDLSASGLWSHLNHWGRSGEPLSVICDDSKPLRAIEDDLDGEKRDGILERAKIMLGVKELGWELLEPIRFVDSRAHPSVQIADILASSAVSIFANGAPDLMVSAVDVMNGAMMQDSIFPDFELIKLENVEARIAYVTLFELAKAAEEGALLDMPSFYAFVEAEAAAGNMDFD